MTDTTRPSLLLRLRNRDDHYAWVEFDTIYRPMLLRFGRGMGLDESNAEEVVQNCMAAILKHIGSFEYDPSRGRFKSWLRTMVNNRIRNVFRDRHERQAATHEFNRADSAQVAPEELFDRLWRQEHVRYCLELVKSEVNGTTYQVFVATVIEERPVAETCQQFDVTPNNIRVIKARMTARLRARMGELLGSE
jgi:RNA polymerase sigma-70 factor (ECF subfamily)